MDVCQHSYCLQSSGRAYSLYIYYLPFNSRAQEELTLLFNSRAQEELTLLFNSRARESLLSPYLNVSLHFYHLYHLPYDSRAGRGGGLTLSLLDVYCLPATFCRASFCSWTSRGISLDMYHNICVPIHICVSMHPFQLQNLQCPLTSHCLPFQL